jgi:hypothetical protein
MFLGDKNENKNFKNMECQTVSVMTRMTLSQEALRVL